MVQAYRALRHVAVPDSPVLVLDPTFPTEDVYPPFLERIDSQERFLHGQNYLLVVDGQLREMRRKQFKIAHDGRAYRPKK